MKLSNFEKLFIQMIKDTWRVLLVMVVLFGFFIWGILGIIEKLMADYSYHLK